MADPISAAIQVVGTLVSSWQKQLQAKMQTGMQADKNQIDYTLGQQQIQASKDISQGKDITSTVDAIMAANITGRSNVQAAEQSKMGMTVGIVAISATALLITVLVLSKNKTT